MFYHINYGFNTYFSVNSNVQHESYSASLLSHIPIKYLVLQARANQSDYRGLYAPLLRLLVIHYPHLCLVDEWLIEEEMISTQIPGGIECRMSSVLNVQSSPARLKTGIVKKRMHLSQGGAGEGLGDVTPVL